MENDALAQMVALADGLPGAFRPTVALHYVGVGAPDPWICGVEGDLLGDDGGRFTVRGRTAAEAVAGAAEEAWSRVPPGRTDSD